MGLLCYIYYSVYTDMNPLISRLLLGFGIIAAIIILARGAFFAPNQEIDSGLQAGTAQSAAIGSVSAQQFPSRLHIPKIDIDAKVQHVGVTRSGNMAAPNNFTDVGWYKYGTAPGLQGSAVIAGHVDNALGTPAVFYELKELEINDDIFVVRADGKKLHYKVIDKEVYEYDKSPTKKIFNDTSGKYLNLITCQGEWVPEAKSARYRLVVYTKLVE